MDTINTNETILSNLYDKLDEIENTSNETVPNVTVPNVTVPNVTVPDENTLTDNNDSDSSNNPTLEILKNMKPLMNDFMNQFLTVFNKTSPIIQSENTFNNDDLSISDDSNDDSNDDLGISDDSSNESKSSNTTTKPTDFFNKPFDNAFSMLETLLSDMNKYKDKPYLSIAPQIFQALSKLNCSKLDTVVDSECTQYVENIQTNSTKICEMLKDSAIIDLCENAEFKSCLLIVSMNLNKQMIWVAKKGVEKLELDLLQLNDTTPVYTLIENVIQKFNNKQN